MKAVWAKRSAEDRKKIGNKIGDTRRETGIARETAKEQWEMLSKDERAERVRPWLDAGTNAVRGKQLSQKHKEQIGMASAKHWAQIPVEQRNVHHIGKKRSLSTRKKISIRSQQRWANEDERKRKSDQEKLRWSKIPYEEKLRLTSKMLKAAFNTRVSKIELQIREILDNHSIRYIPQKGFDGRRFYADIYIPKYRLVIECNGDHWHNLPNRIKRDKEFEQYLTENGYKVIFLWEHDIKNNAKKALQNGLKKVL